MPKIALETLIRADITTCFDLSRSIDLHQISTAASNESAIAGKTAGLIGLGEQVTWEATHFGIRQNLTSGITAYQRPHYFRDEQVKGIFKYMVHDHYFYSQGEHTLMKDEFDFKAPLGILGSIFNKLVLVNYLTKLLKHRNEVIKNFAETEAGKSLLMGK